MSNQSTAALAIAPTGEIRKTGQSGRLFIFKFGWLSRLELELIYGGALEKIAEESDDAQFISNVLLSGLKTVAANNIPPTLDRRGLYEYMDDLGEEAVREVYQAGKHSLGFTGRILGLSAEDLEKLTQAALTQNTDQPTGIDS